MSGRFPEQKATEDAWIRFRPPESRVAGLFAQPVASSVAGPQKDTPAMEIQSKPVWGSGIVMLRATLFTEGFAVARWLEAYKRCSCFKCPVVGGNTGIPTGKQSSQAVSQFGIAETWWLPAIRFLSLLAFGV